MKTPEPSEKYPPLTLDRLEKVAVLIKNARDEVAALHDPDSGDNAWSLGCRAYVRACFALSKGAKSLPWLSVVAEDSPLRFTFAIGMLPIRFYRGGSDELPERYSEATGGELRQLELFKPEDVIPDGVLRLAVEPNSRGEVARVSLVEVNSLGVPLSTFPVLVATDANVMSFSTAAEGVILPPPSLQAIKPTEQRKNDPASR